MQRPTPVVAPVMQWVVDTGTPIFDAIMTVSIAPISIQKPREGDWFRVGGFRVQV